jgi:hypothetical protein
MPPCASCRQACGTGRHGTRNWEPGEDWDHQAVCSYAIDDGERLLLLDPLAPPSEIDEFGGEIASALDYFKVPAREKQELLAVIVSKKTEVVSS